MYFITVHGEKSFGVALSLKFHMRYEVHTKKTSDEITFLSHSTAMPSAIIKTEAIELSKYLMKLSRVENPHYLHAQCICDTLAASENLYNVLELPEQKDESAARSRKTKQHVNYNL